VRARIFQVDAFASRPFAGNPAAVMPMAMFPGESLMQAVANENNLAETAFIVPEGSDYRIRWFTPTVEVPLCGHATLASAAVVMERLEPGRDSVIFQSASGPLGVTRAREGYVMDFPARKPVAVATPAGLVEALGVQPAEVAADDVNYLARLHSARSVYDLAPDFALISRLDRKGLIVTAQADEDYDFVSRYFAPAQGIAEDPVTGSAHCALAPYWAQRLGRDALRAFQASRRGGEILCRSVGSRVQLEGSCYFYMEGEAQI
jgi:PhzF family phenazine biosynthesis protein